MHILLVVDVQVLNQHIHAFLATPLPFYMHENAISLLQMLLVLSWIYLSAEIDDFP
jgi:hypothetical protein